jgi:enoyl-CoA hydratase/carnithine racemase
MTHALLTRREGAVLVLSNNNVAARNALSFEFYAAVTDALRDAASDPSVGAIVLTGEGGHFCSGGDLRQLAKRRELSVAERRVRLEGLHDLIRVVRDCPKPVIAAVEGAAAGAGLSLAMACDMLVAAKDAKFTVAYVKVGLTPDGGATAFLAEFVSRQVLTELCLTGAPLSGEQMHALGAVNRLVASGYALSTAIALASDISQGPQHAMSRIKHLCRHAMRHSLEDQLELEAQSMVEAMASDESLEGINAFLNKRAPNYTQLRQVNE